MNLLKITERKIILDLGNRLVIWGMLIALGIFFVLIVFL
jgi:hypothetical protein